jgi:hypothetical protein
MKAYELEEHLKSGCHIIAAFGSIYLHHRDRRETIHPNIFRALIRDGVLRESCVESGASRFDYRSDEVNINWQERAEAAEARVKELERSNERLKHLAAGNFSRATHYSVLASRGTGE